MTTTSHPDRYRHQNNHESPQHAAVWSTEDIAALRGALKAMTSLSSGNDIARAAWSLSCSVLSTLPLPGQGNTPLRVASLLEIGAHDLALARVLEAHTDAIAILAESGKSTAAPHSDHIPLYGVWAARHADTPLRAEPHLATRAEWRLHGLVPYCTGATLVERALIVASHEGQQLLFDVRPAELSPGVATVWHCAGMERVPASTLTFAAQTMGAAYLVGEPDFYLRRRGFWCGAMGVAACWLGGAIGLLRRWASLAAQRPATPHALAHLGACTAAIDAAVAQLLHAATLIDDPDVTADALRAPALAVRQVTEQVCTDVINRLGRALGPGPMIVDSLLARQLADLTIYLRQSHAERDMETLGTCTLNTLRAEQNGIWPWL